MPGIPNNPKAAERYFAKQREIQKARAEQVGDPVEEVEQEPTPVVEAIEEPGKFPCDTCPFVAKSGIGLVSHQAKHSKEV